MLLRIIFSSIIFDEFDWLIWYQISFPFHPKHSASFALLSFHIEGLPGYPHQEMHNISVVAADLSLPKQAPSLQVACHLHDNMLQETQVIFYCDRCYATSFHKAGSPLISFYHHAPKLFLHLLSWF